MFCAKCGADLPNDSRFCRSCGQTLGVVSVGGGAAAAVAPARIPAQDVYKRQDVLRHFLLEHTAKPPQRRTEAHRVSLQLRILGFGFVQDRRSSLLSSVTGSHLLPRDHASHITLKESPLNTEPNPLLLNKSLMRSFGLAISRWQFVLLACV